MKTTAPTKTTRQFRRYANKANRHALRQELNQLRNVRMVLDGTTLRLAGGGL